MSSSGLVDLDFRDHWIFGHMILQVAGHWNWRFAFFGEAIVMVPFAILGFVIKPLQLKGICCVGFFFFFFDVIY
ncbi:unnamed protein product [Camellia sinensis]